MSLDLVETTVDLIETRIKDEIATGLAAVRTKRADPSVNTEKVQAFFIYEGPENFKTPAIFIVPEIFNFKLEDGPNYTNAAVTIFVSAVVEARKAELANRKVWRYQTALHDILNNCRLSTADVTIMPVVQEARFSATYSSTQLAGGSRAMFRKEVMLELTVYHWEN